MKQKTKRLPLASAVLFALATMAGGMVQAQEAPAAAPEAKPDNEIVYNVAVTSDYRFRGYSQSRLKPALQGGADWVNNPTGFYAGTWASTIKWVKDGGGDASIEWDVYGGKRGDLGGGFGYDVGGLGYIYPSNDLHPNANTFELYGAVTYGVGSLKYSHSLTNLFGFADSKNSSYWDLSANPDMGDGWVVNLHAGHQTVKNVADASYTDWKIGVSKDVGFATVSLAYFDTNTKFYVAPNGKILGRSGAVLTISKTF
ncbi:TorF family putative porin [Massilia endophytica]|uniref:TorF family putative porin n=1 Tax=Massilia endophytica TaxID=2899220 RepID=UPI001E624D18|nr:TorF family putative porin [Massilia endophytica]UGQ46991.1 TorF family putative porin [Massilia endophytica]